MNLTKLTSQSASSDWNAKWEDIFDHYQNDIRHGHYIRALLRPDENKILEIGAGSFRDMAFLCSKGIECDGFDFSETAADLARQRYPELRERISVRNAFQTTLPDSHYDLSYHNGFFSCFSIEEVSSLLKEQARISTKRIVATVHNAHNTDFVEYFKRKRVDDPLFDARFFTIDEMKALMSPYCRSIRVIPVGKGKKRYEDWLIKHHLAHPKLLKTCFSLAGLRFLESSERLLCIGEL